MTTESFGTLDLGGAAALAQASEIAKGCGVDLSSHRTRQVGQSSLAEVDLLLGFEEAHVQRAVVDGQAPRSRAFTTGGIIRLLTAAEISPHHDPVERARQVVRHLESLRAGQPDPGRNDDLPDPFGRSWEVYRDTATKVREVSILLAEALFGVSDTRGLAPVPTRQLRRPRIWRR